jgi:hypothetical protein
VSSADKGWWKLCSKGKFQPYKEDPVCYWRERCTPLRVTGADKTAAPPQLRLSLRRGAGGPPVLFCAKARASGGEVLEHWKILFGSGSGLGARSGNRGNLVDRQPTDRNGSAGVAVRHSPSAAPLQPMIHPRRTSDRVEGPVITKGPAA